MRYDLLTETVSYDEIRSQPFFNKFDKFRLYHGMRHELDEPTIIPFRFRKKPVDTPEIIHNSINKVSEETFGVPIRNLKFLYPSSIQTRAYGKPYMVIPKGHFKLYTNPTVYDMTVDYDLDDIRSDMYYDAFEILFDRIKESVQEFLLELYDEEDESELQMIVLTIDKLEPIGRNYTNDIVRYSSNNPATSFREYIRTSAYKLLDDDVADYIDSILDQMINSVLNMWFKRFATEYVNGVIEVKSDSDANRPSEFMLYAPDGMYIIPENSKIWNTLYRG